MKKIEQNKIMCSKWFQSLRNLICKEIEALEEGSVKFKRKKYKIGFFVENKNILEYLLPYIEIKSHREKIFIISFEDLDLQLKNVKIYTFHSNLIRELFFLILKNAFSKVFR